MPHVVTGDNFKVAINAQGQLISYVLNGMEMISKASGPNFWRAPIDNDFGNDLHKRSRVWREAGENRKVTAVDVKQIAGNVVQMTLTLVGVACLLCLMIFVSTMDIQRLFF